jgi:hypothetical protein
MSILSSIRDFGSNVVSGIGDIFHSSPTSTQPTIVSSPSTSGTLSDNIVDSIYSRIASWIAPDDRPVETSTQPQVVYIPQGGSAAAPGVGDSSKIFGIPQVTLLVVLGGVAAYLIVRRK